ncbi:cytochrome P450 [Nocardia cerradoensis]|uniref:cytochrome P450 n=1 Tax=Nocardia cerradoensis TaxID=85688 RepID=UPI000313C836|nr:cytochrome P450 [Nocardia cerradoensis]NKY42866.1 cytochrome P450 [Nocardia cerradoensis]
MSADRPRTSLRRFHALDVSDPTFWHNDFRTRDRTFATLRSEPGLSWHPPVESIFPHEERGYWAVTRHADIQHISRHPEIFCSRMGISMDPMPAEMQRAISFFLTMDPPEHTRYRKLISVAFTPKQVRRIESQIRANAAAVVDELLADLRAHGTVDFAATYAKKLPMRTISDMIGLDPVDREPVAFAAESLFSTTDEEYASLAERAPHLMTQLSVLTGAGIDLARRRRDRPREDLMSGIVAAEVDGHRLTDEEIGAFTVLLGSAGNDTTKQASSHALAALAAHPEQRTWLLADFDDRIDGAVEEFVRWATPVMHFARHATIDTEVAGTPVAAGEKLVLFYCSANRDATVFDRPHDFDLSRSPNPHVGFGGPGPHFCLGRQLAKMELRHLFRELLTRLPEFRVGEPDYVHSDFVHGVKRLPLSLR